MLDLSGIGRRSLVGRVLRLPLRLIPRNLTVPIAQGQLKGKKWIVGSFNHGCWLGSYEFEKQQVIVGLVKPGTVFFDIGAHVGFYTLLASSLVADGGRVIAFEPLPKNLNYLERHCDLNGLKNVTVIKGAVSNRAGKAQFREDECSSMGHLSERGELEVDLVSLDDLFSRNLIPLPNYVKIDVEGAEANVLNGARQLLAASHPIIFLATHGREVHTLCLEILESMGYSCRPLQKDCDLQSCDELIATKCAQ